MWPLFVAGIGMLLMLCSVLSVCSCIEKWLKGQVGKCPQCNAKSHRKDIRPLFARTLKVIVVTVKL